MVKDSDKQILDLQQEYKGQLLSVHHPDEPNAPMITLIVGR